MTEETNQVFSSTIALLGILAFIFIFQKVYFHYKLIQARNVRYKDIPLFGALLNPSTLFEIIHIIVPVYFKSAKSIPDKERYWESLVTKNLRFFWMLIGALMLISLLASGLNVWLNLNAS